MKRLLVTMVLAVALAAFVLRGRISTFLARQHADRLYQARAWPAAQRAFQLLLREATTARESDALPGLDYDVATTDYRLGRFAAAAQNFHTAVAGDRRLAERAYYNLGNTYVWQARSSYDHVTKREALRAAVESYEEALVIDPHDPDAKWNLEVALRRLADATDAPSPFSRHRNAADWGGGNLTKSGYAGTPQTAAGTTPGGGFGQPGDGDVVPQLDVEQAHKLLNAVERAQVGGQELNGPITRRPPSPQREPDY
jgi:tetratricopeptide (TPR) repeat protein